MPDSVNSISRDLLAGRWPPASSLRNDVRRSRRRFDHRTRSSVASTVLGSSAPCELDHYYSNAVALLVQSTEYRGWVCEEYRTRDDDDDDGGGGGDDGNHVNDRGESVVVWAGRSPRGSASTGAVVVVGERPSSLYRRMYRSSVDHPLANLSLQVRSRRSLVRPLPAFSASGRSAFAFHCRRSRAPAVPFSLSVTRLTSEGIDFSREQARSL